jgi:hypothetical protein
LSDGVIEPLGEVVFAVPPEPQDSGARGIGDAMNPSFNCSMKITCLLSTLILSSIVFAEGTRTWEQSKFEELAKGTAKGIALRSNGGLELAPTFKPLATTPSTYIWSIASDPAGNLYAAAGSPARVYRITPEGQITPIFEPQELQVQALVVDKDGIIYAATAPDGKVYRIQPVKPTDAKSEKPVSPSFSATPIFDPGTKYIWDLVVDNAGTLYVATGDHGEIFKLTANGQHSLFFKSDEVHIRVLALDLKGNVIAGSDGSGLIYRITPAGEAFVLYSAAKHEITALAVDQAGNIYAAAAGEKRSGVTTPSPTSLVITTAPTAAAAPGSASVNPPLTAATFPAPGTGATGGSEIYRLAPDGSPTKLWSSREDLVYALGFDQHGRLLAGTGNRGHVFAINGDDDFTDLVKASASQITAFATAPHGGLYVSSSNLAKIFLLGPGPEDEGGYESDVFDARNFSRWGRATMRSVGNVELWARSGNVDNPDRNWSPWTRVDPTSSELRVPSARFVQWKSVLRAGTGPARVDSVLVYYLPKNVAPEIDDITVQPGYRYQPTPRAASNEPSTQGPARFDSPPPSVRDRDAIGIRWSAHDDNDDQLTYALYYRGDGESRWLLMKNDLSDRFYSFDADLLPDGGYTVKVVASDAASHSPGEALSAERESARFEVDTTPPVVESLTAVVEGRDIHVRFRARDSFSPVKRAEVSVDGADWQFVEPTGQLADSKTEDYDCRVPVSPPDATSGGSGQASGKDHVVAVRAYDRFDNQASAKVLILGK